MAKKRETTREKGQRLNAEGRVERIGTDAKGDPVFAVDGDSGRYIVKKGGTFFYCGCPSRKGDCSHVEAVNAARDAEMGEPEAAEVETGGVEEVVLEEVVLDTDDVETAIAEHGLENVGVRSGGEVNFFLFDYPDPDRIRTTRHDVKAGRAEIIVEREALPTLFS